jgi:hypothetical protein
MGRGLALRRKELGKQNFEPAGVGIYFLIDI